MGRAVVDGLLVGCIVGAVDGFAMVGLSVEGTKVGFAVDSAKVLSDALGDVVGSDVVGIEIVMVCLDAFNMTLSR